MAHWVFMDYVSPAGTNLIKKWSRKNLTIQGRSDLEAMLSFLGKQKQWGEPDFKALSGKHLQGIGEIRFRSDGASLRVAGVCGAIAGQYILLAGFSKAGQKKTDPADALDTAIERKKLLTQRRGTICEHEEDNGEIEEE